MNDARSNRPIGVFDSGIGGLTVLREILRQMPEERILYFGDTARVPYGTKSGKTVTSFTLEAAEFLLAQDIKALVVACNTASAYAIPALRDRFGIPVVGVIESGAQAALEIAHGGAIGVISTSATRKSHAYEQAIRHISPTSTIYTQACPLFVPLVEEGWVDSDVTRQIAEEYLAPLRDHNLDCLILGCTHYPLLKQVIQRVIGEGVQLVDAGDYTARALAKELDRGSMRATRSSTPGSGDEPEHKIYLSDLPQTFRITSEHFLGQSLPLVEVVGREEEKWVRVGS